MYYPTHSVSMALSVTGQHVSEVACFGRRDAHEDGIFRQGANHWENPFSNESALMRTTDGGVVRINEMRRIGWHGGNSVSMSFYGTDGAFEQNAVASCWINKIRGEKPLDVTAELTCAALPRRTDGPKDPNARLDDEFFTKVTTVHPVERLPDSFRGLPNGHYGSHQFLVDDFCTAWVTGGIPPCNAWNAARWNLPGIIAHESAMRNGQPVTVPDFGDVPPDYRAR